MKKIILAAAVTLAAGGAAFAAPPYYVINGQVYYPGQMDAPASHGPDYRHHRHDRQTYSGGSYAQVPPGYYNQQPGYGSGYYNRPGNPPGIYVFKGLNINDDENYNGR
jgi:hypothetical protein